MSDTVDAIGYRADVPSRAKDTINERVRTMKGKISGASSQLSEASPDAQDLRHAVGMAQENPLGLAIGAAALGFLGGLLLPSTRMEDERLGPVADQVKEQVRETGQEAIEHGKQVAQEAAQVVTDKVQEAVPEITEAAQDSAEQHAAQLKASVQEGAEAVKQTAQQ